MLGSGVLACRTHWFMVSRDTRNDVTVTWLNFMDDPAAYLEARAQAVLEMNR